MIRLLTGFTLTLLLSTTLPADPPALNVLFLGDDGHHRPAARFAELRPVLDARGIKLTYTNDANALDPETLADYDGLIVYANIGRITPEQEKALLDYVAGGKGFVPIHCASACFGNSPKYIELVGAQFQRHGTGVFRTTIAEPNHAIMRGFRGFESWDETYVHHQHNEKDRIVLEYRDEGSFYTHGDSLHRKSPSAYKDRREPWTWVRTHGRGRVFYTAWGHDSRTWGNPGFHNLIERGIRWATGGDPGVAPPFADQPEMTKPRKDVKPFEYVEAKIPYYPAGQRWGTMGKPITKMQKPLSPEESIKHMVTPVGFEVRLFAAEPDIGKPICMNWDHRGRLWLCESVDYPNELQPPGKGRDRLRICEDTDGDGRADKFTVFAEKLSIPTSLTFAYGGVVVHQAPHTLFLKDTDGDDRADVREILFTGWSTRDTHAGPSNLQYGLDNWYYGIVGYSGFDGTVAGEKHSFRTGFYRFKLEGGAGLQPAKKDRLKTCPTVTKLEFLRNTNNNSWGLGISEEGHIFGSTANRNPSVHLTIPNRYYERVRGWSSSVLGSIALDAKFDPITDKVRQVDHHGNFTAAAGHALYTARTYPKEYWNRTAFVCGPTGHLVATFVLQPSGGTFVSRNAWNLVASDDEWFAPIAAEVGPDGHVWVLDWYNYIVQHNPTPAGFKTGPGNAYMTKLRDKKHGRVYRVVWQGAGKQGSAVRDQESGTKRLTLAGASPEKLLATLKHPSMLWRRHAQRLLVERGKPDIAPALVAMVNDDSADELGLNVAAIHALWTLKGCGVDTSLKGLGRAVGALVHKSPGVRRNALKSVTLSEPSVFGMATSGLKADPQLQLAKLLAYADSAPIEVALSEIAQFVDNKANGNDRWAMDAATSAAVAQDAVAFLEIACEKFSELHPQALQVVQRVGEHVARTGNPKHVPRLIQAIDEAGDLDVALAILSSLSRAWPNDRPVMLAEPTERLLVGWIRKAPPAVRSHAVLLGRRWGSKAVERYAKEIAATFLEQVQDEKRAEQERLLAAGRLVEFVPEDADTIKELLKLVTPRTSPQLAAGLMKAIGQSQDESVGHTILAAMPSFTPAVRQAGIRVLLSRAAWTQALLDGLDQRRIPLAELSLDQKQSLAAHPDRMLAARAKTLLARGGGLPSPDRQKVLKELLPLTKRVGDVAAGNEVFKKQCAKCHTHSGEGTKIGPDLTGMAVHPKAELLMQIIDPSRDVEGNYRSYTVVTEGGRTLTGLLASETKTSMELFDTEGKKQIVLREDIARLVASPKSLMPEGFEKQVKPEDIVNLLEFLTQRGKFLPLPLAKAATITSVRGMFFREESPVERLIFPDWSPKEFAGVPFHLVDPQGKGRVPNVVLLYGPQGTTAPKMPKRVSLPCNTPAKAIHLLSGISGWGYPLGRKGSVSMIVRLYYADEKTEDHPLRNGHHFADYIRRVDVPESQFAFNLRGKQLRYLAVLPKRTEKIERIEFIKGPDRTAPIVMAVTVETGE